METTCKVEGDEIVLRIPIEIAVYSFNNSSENLDNGVKVKSKKKFAKALASHIVDSEREAESGIPYWGEMLDTIGQQMLEDGDESLRFD